MTFNFDFSSADEGLRLLSKIQTEKRPTFRDWWALFNTSGYGALLENKLFTKRDIKEYFLKGSKGDFPGASLFQREVETLSAQSDQRGQFLLENLKSWLPEELHFEHFSVAYALFGGRGEATDPAVIDLNYDISLSSDERDDFLLGNCFVLLLKRYQNLEKYYLKHYLPIRRYMNFIVTLWLIQTEGVSHLMTLSDNERESLLDQKEVFSQIEKLDEILTLASSATAKDLPTIGEDLSLAPLDHKFLGAFLYGSLRQGLGKEAFELSLKNPVLIFPLLRDHETLGEILSPEANFFIDQIGSLLS